MKTGVRRFTLGAMTTVLGVAIVLSGCSGGAKNGQKPENKPADGPVVGGTLIDTGIGDAKVLLPILVSDNASDHVVSMIFDPLLNRDNKLGYKPGIVEKWTIEQDKVYTFNLRKDVKFHDGHELTSEDVLFTFLAVAHPKYQGLRFDNFTGIKGWAELGDKYEAIKKDLDAKKIDEKKADELKMAAYNDFVKTGGLTAPDKYTVRVELAEPFAPFLNSFTGYGIMPKHIYEKSVADLKNAPETKKPIGSGAYKFVEWVKDDHITLERNPEWKFGLSGKPQNIQRIIVKVVPDSQANMVALETRETDVAQIQADNFDHFKNEVKHVNLKEYMAFAYTYVGYNLRNPMFSDVRVRRAITHAINRQEIVDTLLKGHGAVAHGHSSPSRWDYNPNLPVVNYDVAKAEQLLDEAGWKKGPDGFRYKDGKKFSFEIATNNGNKLREQSAVIIQQALKKVGIEVTPSLMEWNAFLDYKDTDKVQAYILGWSLGFDPDAYPIFHTKGGFNMHGYSNPKIDDLIIKGRTTTDQEKRAQIYGEMQKLLIEDQPYTWLFFSNTIYGINSRVGGIGTETSPGGIMWNLDQWYLKDVQAAQ